jgi:hypoxanthine phosphoribosyltransferase
MTRVGETELLPGGKPLKRVVFSADEIRARVEELGDEVSRAYDSSEGVLVIGLLKGSFIFMADLVRNIRLPVSVDFLVASSYGAEKTSSGNVRLLYDPEASLRDRDVLLVEDIVDSGHTLNELIPQLMARRPRSLEVCALLHKRVARLDREPRWVGFDAPEEFLVGYGLDFAEDFRHLPFIGSI